MGVTRSVSHQRSINMKLFKHGHAFFSHPVYGKVKINELSNNMAVVAFKGEQIRIDIGLLEPVISSAIKKNSKQEIVEMDGLNVFCRICGKKCADKDKQLNDVKIKLFNDCIKIMLDDLGVFFEYLRLKSPAGKTICAICAIRSFFHYTIINRMVFMYQDRKQNTRDIIPPRSIINCFKEAVIRWDFLIPKDCNFEPLEKLLVKSMNYNAKSDLPLKSERKVATKCPQCGGLLTVTLSDNDVGQLSKGSRYIHKIVEHGTGDNVHGVNIVKSIIP